MSKFVQMLTSMLPFLKVAAAVTPTPVDDAIVAILEGLVKDPSKAPQVLAAMNSSK